MTRPNAAYVGMGLSHPIRLVLNLHKGVRMISVNEARELVTDLTSAIERAIENKKPRITHGVAADDPKPHRPRA